MELNFFLQIIEFLRQNFTSEKLELHHVYILCTLDNQELTYLGDTSLSLIFVVEDGVNYHSKMKEGGRACTLI